MKYIEEYLKDVIKVEPLGELTTMDDNLYGMSGEMVYIDGKCSGIFISHADYVNWIEKQNPKFRIGETINKFRIGDTIKRKSTGDIVTISDIDLKNREYRLSNTGFIPFKYEYLWELVEQNPADKVKPKFKVGDWISHNTANFVFQVVSFGSCGYEVINRDNHTYIVSFDNEDNYHLWTIQDAKDGDVLVYGEQLFLFKRMNTSNSFYSHCSYHFIGYDSLSVYDCSYSIDNIYPATKEQRDLLFQKMKESGYEWKNNQLEAISNKDYVDLGLPSGTLWAKCNLGAEKETDFGLFFQWGDTKGYKGVDDHQFSWDDYKWGHWVNLAKYAHAEDKIVLDKEDDPVYIATGKMKSPTKEQLRELINNTNHEWTTIDGVNGMKFINKNDTTKYIFIPAAGSCNFGFRNGAGSWGRIWSASRNESNASDVWSMNFNFNAGDIYMGKSYRCSGYSVRGVVDPQAETFDEIDDTDDGQPVDLGLPSGTKWMKSNVGATKPSDFGKFYQWGDTQGYSNVDGHEFNWDDYKFGNYNSLTKYNDTDRLTLLDPSDDAAICGGGSIPTKDQLQELIDNTEHRWLRLANGVNGMKFWKKGTEEPTDGDSYIFIPAAGDCFDGFHYDVGYWGNVWSASRNESSALYAWRVLLNAGDVGVYDSYRYYGCSVRGVVNIKDKKK